MSISSILFLFGILPIFLIIYYISKPSVRIYELLIMSAWFFYLNAPHSLLILIFLVSLNYLISLGIAKSSNKTSMILLVSGIVGNVGILIYYKYTGFIEEVIGIPISFKPQYMMTGISFFVFALISYLVDIYKKKAIFPSNPVVFADYTMMFPKVLSGPIIRYSDCSSDYDTHSISASDIGMGARIFMGGYIKKTLIADNLYLIIKEINAISDAYRNATIVSLWLGAVAFSLQLYFDFSGYSDMAVGLARMLGFHFKSNFNYPYMCKGFTDFWRRWHITLSEWFRDYIYIPLGGSRKTTTRNIFNLFIVWLLTGIWHGAGYNFIVWGLVFFGMLVLEKYIIKPKRLHKIPSLLWRIFTLLVINFNWVLFSHSTLEDGVRYCLGMVGYYGNAFYRNADGRLVREYGVFIVLGILFSIPIASIIQKKTEKRVAIANMYCIIAPILMGLAFIWALSFALLGYHNPFMYQQF